MFCIVDNNRIAFNTIINCWIVRYRPTLFKTTISLPFAFRQSLLLAYDSYTVRDFSRLPWTCWAAPRILRILSATIFTAEIHALDMALDIIRRTRSKDCVVFSDTLQHVRYFGVATLKDVFENVASRNIIAYVKNINFCNCCFYISLIALILTSILALLLIHAFD